MIMANLSIAGNRLETALWVKTEATLEVKQQLKDKFLCHQRVKPDPPACG
jgi:hypothetical protein